MTAPGAHARVPLNLWDDLTWLDACLASRGLWSTALTWSADQLTDGLVSTARLRRLGASDGDINRAIDDGLFFWAADGGDDLAIWRFGDCCQLASVVLANQDEAARKRTEKARKAAAKRWGTESSPMLEHAQACSPMLGDAQACSPMPTTPKPNTKPRNASSIDPGIPRATPRKPAPNPDPSDLAKPPTLPTVPWPAEAITIAEISLADPDGRPAPDGAFVGPEDFLAGRWARWQADPDRARDGPLTAAGWTALFVQNLARTPRKILQ